LTAIRRARVLDDLTPRKFEERVGETAGRNAYNLVAAVIAGALLLLYKVTVDDEAALKQEMLATTAELRRRRAHAKRALLTAAAAPGGETGELDVGRSKYVKYYAAGPADGDMLVLLQAEDGDTAALWGLVVARLAAEMPRARIVAFHRPGIHFNPSKGVQLTLRMRDRDAVLGHFLTEMRSARRVAASTSGSGGIGGKWWGGSSGSSASGNLNSAGPRVISVSHGEGAWANAVFAATHSDSVAAAICVHPLLMYRGKRTAWVDAVNVASRVTAATDPDALQRTLDPPPLDADPQLLAMEAARREAAGAVVKMAKTISGRAADATDPARRLAEDMRRQRATETVLSELDVQLLLSVGATAGKEGAPAVHALTIAPDALPRFVRRDQLLSTATWLLQATNALGMAWANEPARERVTTARAEAARDMATELSNGMFSPPPPAGAAEPAAATAAAPNTAAATAPTTPPALPPGLGTPVGTFVSGHGISAAAPQSLVFSLGMASATALAIASGPQDYDAQRTQAAFRRARQLLSFDAPVPPTSSFSFLYLQSELGWFPPNFTATLVDAQTPAPPPPPAPWWRRLFVDWMSPTAGVDANAHLASIPLQAPDAVVDAILAAAAAPPPAHPAATAATAPAPAARGYAHWPTAAARSAAAAAAAAAAAPVTTTPLK